MTEIAHTPTVFFVKVNIISFFIREIKKQSMEFRSRLWGGHSRTLFLFFSSQDFTDLAVSQYLVVH